ncbi:hypothetical protein RMN57_17200 [Kitasatospora sp. CM 4170]|uniref:Uncharacterized protein n=1 Tax=Kitasatospora aburaviensis TaxID=67265 RepID=A0ABW1EU42_9ACTN|nr:hypothetical protein [Kitasatospora sp. CM 4170]WNM46313.1 hypothetical protein RMN57_17200 [Kitasatospora sp. CM 4170]
MEKIFPTEKLSATLVWPLTGLAAGTPVLIRRLTAPQRERRAEAAALKADQERLAAEAAQAADAEFAKKLAETPDPTRRAAMIHARESARVTAREIEAEQAKATRQEKRGRAGDAAGAAALMLIVGGPLVWALARPLIEPGIGLLIGVWWIAALIHAPAPGKKAVEEKEEEAEQNVAEDVSEQPPPTPDQASAEARGETSAATSPTPADARRAVALLGAAGTHVALTAVTARLAADHPLWKRSGKAVRGLLHEAGVEVRGGVRVEGVSVPGIHHDDVPPLPSPSDSAPDRVVVAGQSNNNNANNGQEWSTREGFIMRTDPDNPARTIIVSRTNAA